MSVLYRYIRAFLHSYSEIFFLQSPVAGALFCFMTLLNPNAALCGIIAVASAYAFASFLKMKHHFLESGFFTYNALLVGLSIGFIMSISPVTLFLVVIMGILTFVISLMINAVLSYYLLLPTLSIPFVICSSLIYAGFSDLTSYPTQYSQWATTENLFDITLPYWIKGYLTSLSYIIFTPNVFVGAIIASILFWHSRILFLLSLFGFFSGAIITAILYQDTVSAFLQPSNFNFILIGVALGGIFLVPSIQSAIVAFIGVSIATIILKTTDALAAQHGILVFTLPFNVITLSFLYSLRLVGFPLIPKATRNTPEETLDDHISGLYRFRNGTLCNLSLPFSGKWTVWQGFDGKWTHQGALRYAYDFVIKRDGKTFKNEGAVLEDYYCYRKPVLSPCRGRVIRIENDKLDNIPGTVDRESNWGNYVIIDTELGHFVELSHFAQGSIKVKEGQWVENGVQLGLCGNSGYSPQPHIHVQIQTAAALNSPTIPFNFYTFIINNKAINNDLPREGQEIEPLYLDREMDLKTSFILEQKFIYKVSKNGEHYRDVTLTVRISDTGETYFDSGKGKLFFFKGSHHFYFYRMEGNDPLLSTLFMALPKMPLNHKKGMIWNDFIPISATPSTVRKHLLSLMRLFNHRFGYIRYTARWSNSNTFIGIVHHLAINKKVRIKVMLNDNLGFKEIHSNGTKWILHDIGW